jgi:DNA-binding IclR family transcriptional regulator
MTTMARAGSPGLQARDPGSTAAATATGRERASHLVGSDGPQRRGVAPFARALALLSAYTPQDSWLGNGELAARTGLPRSTVTRIAQSLVALGYLHHEPAGRKYRLAPAVLALGFAATANTQVQAVARSYMQRFADQHKLNVNISARDRLDLIVLASCDGAGAQVPFDIQPGLRMSMPSSAIGWALLATLPEIERQYLIGSIERRAPREWARYGRRVSQAIAQVHERGFCSSVAALYPSLRVVAVPLVAEGQAPLVLTCVGNSDLVSTARVERELGPRLRGLADTIVRALSGG